MYTLSILYKYLAFFRASMFLHFLSLSLKSFLNSSGGARKVAREGGRAVKVPTVSGVQESMPIVLPKKVIKGSRVL